MKFFSKLRLIFARFSVVLALLWERSAPVFFPALLFPALYSALALFGVWEYFGDPWRLITLMASVGLTLYFITIGIRQFSWPPRAEQARRLEDDAHLPGRPLEVLNDQPVENQDSQGHKLWQAHQARAREAIKRLTPRKPHAAFAKRDVYGLRAAAFLLLFAGLILAGPRAKLRLDEAFAPHFLSHSTNNARIEAWITGPEYAQAPPLFLNQNQTGPIETLKGSNFHLKVSGAARKPSLRVQENGKKRRLKMQKTGPQSYDLSLSLAANSVLSLSRPNARLWQIIANDDQSPNIIYTKEPFGDSADALAFSYAAKDDVGVAAISLTMLPVDGAETAQTVSIDLPVLNAKTVDDSPMLDFTRHRWAGSDVEITLMVHDGAGQTSTAPTHTMKLPQKLFVNPVAKAIAEQRSIIISNDQPFAPLPERPALYEEDARNLPAFAQDNPAERLERAPAPVQRVAKMMRASLRAPEMFFEDPLVYVGLRYAAENLRLASANTDYAPLDEELWLLALWAEGGALADARAALKAAERAFRRALARGAPADELARLMNNYERAVKRYLDALAEEALRRGQMAQNGGGNGPNMDSDQLQEMLDALKALSETGARGDARKLLQALSQLLQNMQMQMAAGSGAGDDAASEAMRKALEELGDITAEQRELLDEMFRQQQEQSGQSGGGSAEGGQPQGGQAGAGQQGGQPQGGQAGSGLAGEQESLGARLRALAQGQNEDGQAGAGGVLDEGADEMARAAQALKDGDGEGAMGAGQDALSALREGSEVLAGELFEHLQNQNGEGDGGERDPFGRPTRGGGSQSASGTEVPDIIDAERAREILQILRDRAAEQGRSAKELEYLDRLLERF